jgi:hypothetical protein
MATLFDEPPDLPGGEALRDGILGRFEGTAADPLLEARHVFLGLLLGGRVTVSIDDVRPRVYLPPGANAQKLAGYAVPLEKAGIVERVGDEKTNRKTSHARRIGKYALRNPAAARDWLAKNPLPA